MRQETAQALTVSANGASAAAWSVQHRREKTVQIAGTFSGLVTVEGTIDGTSWAPVAGPVTAPCILAVPQALMQVRIAGSSWVSGTASAVLSSFNSRTE